MFNDTLEMVCLFLYVKKKTDNLKYCLIKTEVCRVGESAPVRENMDDRQQEIWQWIGNTNSTSELL